MNVISKAESDAISFVRVCAMISIVSCHLLQAYSNHWAWVLNVGVQVFLVLSGYLYGHKCITQWKEWFWSRIKKLYVPFLLFSLTVLMLLDFFTDEYISLKNYFAYIVDIQGVCGGVKGLSHLWFMTAIACCYVTTPVLQKFKRFAPVLLLILLVVGGFEYLYIKRWVFHFSWFWLYAVGYYYACLNRKWHRNLFLALLTIVFLILSCKIDKNTVMSFHNLINRAWHDFLGLILCFYGISLLSHFNLTCLRLLVRPIDKYSYYVYITHHVFILGSFSMIPIVYNVFMNVFVILVLTVSSALLLNRLSLQVNSLI